MQFMTILEIGGLPKAEKKEDKTRNHMLGTGVPLTALFGRKGDGEENQEPRIVSF
jgi:hypothetical protein